MSVCAPAPPLGGGVRHLASPCPDRGHPPSGASVGELPLSGSTSWKRPCGPPTPASAGEATTTAGTWRCEVAYSGPRVYAWLPKSMAQVDSSYDFACGHGVRLRGSCCPSCSLPFLLEQHSTMLGLRSHFSVWLPC